MPGLESNRWQQVPGYDAGELFPFIRKPDIVSCNSYVIRTRSRMVIIDPGADSEQMAAILKMVRDGAMEGRSATFYLTHCHVDHCFQIVSAYKDPGAGQVDLVVQEIGARALMEHDADLTQAKVMGWTFPPSSMDVHCSPLTTCHDLKGEVSLGTSMEAVATENGLTVDRHMVPLDGGAMEVYHTPGHSPDSVCYLLGRVLFTGDLLFAADPGIAGIVGWSRDDLVRSVKNVLWLLRTRDIELCCPGHGRPLDRDKALAVLEGMLSRAGELGAIRTYDLDRVRFTSDYALDILMEANEAFTILAGRLYYLSYCLEELEESEEARRCMDSIQADKIDELLAGFHRFVEEFKEGQKVQLQVILKSIQTIQSIDRLFSGTDLKELMDASLLRRTSRLLSDFTNAIKGVEFHIEPSATRLDTLVDRTIATLVSLPPSEDEIMDALGDDQAYLAALAHRIAHLSVYDDMVFNMSREAGHDAEVLVDQGRFVDALCGLLEEYIGVQAREITIIIGQGERPTLTILSDHRGRMLTMERERAHHRRFELSGAWFHEDVETSCFVVEILPPGTGR